MWEQQDESKRPQIFSAFSCETGWWEKKLSEWKSGQILIWGRKSTFSHGKYKKCKDIQCMAGEELNEQIWKELDSKVTLHRPWQVEIRNMIGHCFTDRLRT